MPSDEQVACETARLRPGAVMQRRARRRSAGLVGLTFAFCIACGADKAAQKQAHDVATFAAAAEQDPDLADPLGRAIVERVQSAAPGWVKEGPLLRGSLEEHGRQAFLLVLKYGHCYRLVAVAGDEARDMDLLLFDSNGVETQRDVTQDAMPVLGASASICPEEPHAMRVEARMRAGRGPFAIALLHDPD